LLALDPAEIESLIARRNQARKQKDFAEADAIRTELAKRGVEIMDTPAGTRWRVA
jgi:cysteinyl-tRNA synthetase